MIRIAFRLDDPSVTSLRSLEEDILALLERHAMCCSFAVIPFRDRPEGEVVLGKSASHIIEAHKKGILEVALHGYKHQRTKLDSADTEFAGVPLAGQVDMLTRGKNCLESLLESPVVGFIPPWNSYDVVTLQALKDCGFSYISAGKKPPFSHQSSLGYVPLSCHIRQLRTAIKEARRFKGAQPAIVVVMHHFDFIESKQEEAVTSIAEFADVLAWLSQQDDIKVSTLGEIAVDSGSQQAQRQLQQEWWQVHIPYRFHWLIPTLCFTARSLWHAYLNPSFRN